MAILKPISGFLNCLCPTICIGILILWRKVSEKVSLIITAEKNVFLKREGTQCEDKLVVKH